MLGAEPLLQIDVVGKKGRLAAASLGSHPIWEVRRYLIYLLKYIIYIAELGNTPCRRRLHTVGGSREV